MESIKAPKKINIMEALIEAWQLISGLKWPIFKRLMLTMILSLVFVVVSIFAFGSSMIVPAGGGGNKTSFHIFNFILGLVFAYIGTKIWIPAIMMGVRQAIGLKPDLRIIKEQCAKVKDKLFNLIIIYILLLNFTLLLARLVIEPDFMGLIFTVVVAVACMFLIIPINFFAFPLVIIRNKDTKSALDSAYKKMAIYWKEVLGAFLILTLIPFIMGLLQFFMMTRMGVRVLVFFVVIELIIYFWLLPMNFTLGGIFFRDVYGLQKIKPRVASKPDAQPPEEAAPQ